MLSAPSMGHRTLSHVYCAGAPLPHDTGQDDHSPTYHLVEEEEIRLKGIDLHITSVRTGQLLKKLAPSRWS